MTLPIPFAFHLLPPTFWKSVDLASRNVIVTVAPLASGWRRAALSRPRELL